MSTWSLDTIRQTAGRFGRRRRMRRALVAQYAQSDCGPAALLTLLRVHGGDANLPCVRHATYTDSIGTTLFDLASGARALGFDADGMLADYDSLCNHGTPCIAHIVNDAGQDHYVVVFDVTPRSLMVADPARGVYRLAREVFQVRWVSQAVLVLTPTPALRRERHVSWVAWCLNLARTDAVFAYQSVFLGAVVTAAGLTSSLLVQLIVDDLIPRRDTTMLAQTAMVLVAVQSLRIGSSYIRARMVLQLNQRFGVRMMTQLFHHLFHLPLDFFMSRQRGDVTARLQDGVRLQGAAMRVLGTAVTDVLLATGGLLFLEMFAPAVAGLALVAMCAYGGAAAFAANRLRTIQRAVVTDYAIAEASYVDSITGIEAIQGTGAATEFIGRNARHFEAFQTSGTRLGRQQAAMLLATDAVGGSLLIGTLVYGTHLAIAGSMSVGHLLAAYTLLGLMLAAASRLVETSVVIQGASAAANRLLDVLLLETQDAGGRSSFPRAQCIRIVGGVVRAAGGVTLLDDVSIEIVPGVITALSGPSGSGKTTLVRVLERKVPLAAGRLAVGSTSVDEIDLADYRAAVATVPESVTLFNGTIADNVLMGRAKAPDAVPRLLETFGLTKVFDRYPEGLATRVGEGGRALSSGERQLVGLLRAVLTEPQLLIVDESVNAVDSAVTDDVMFALERYSRNHAVLLISHHADVLARATRHIRLHQGRVLHDDADAFRSRTLDTLPFSTGPFASHAPSSVSHACI
ncbi:MAG: ABC transporter transmembrane domain-containing protein [bacterium]